MPGRRPPSFSKADRRPGGGHRLTHQTRKNFRERKSPAQIPCLQIRRARFYQTTDPRGRPSDSPSKHPLAGPVSGSPIGGPRQAAIVSRVREQGRPSPWPSVRHARPRGRVPCGGQRGQRPRAKYGRPTRSTVAVAPSRGVVPIFRPGAPGRSNRRQRCGIVRCNHESLPAQIRNRCGIIPDHPALRRVTHGFRSWSTRSPWPKQLNRFVSWKRAIRPSITSLRDPFGWTF